MDNLDKFYADMKKLQKENEELRAKNRKCKLEIGELRQVMKARKADDIIQICRDLADAWVIYQRSHEANDKDMVMRKMKKVVEIMGSKRRFEVVEE